MEEVGKVLARLLEIDEELDESVEDPYLVDRNPPSWFEPVKRFEHVIELPRPPELGMPLDEVIARRRSRREFNPFARIGLGELSAILHASVGLTAVVDGVYGRVGYPLRASPSAGALHCVDVYVAAMRVEGLAEGLYYYDYTRHGLAPICAPCYPYTIVDTIRHGPIREAPAFIIYVADLRRGVWKYGKRFYKYCLVDVGAAAENMHLAATALGLGSVMVAGFDKSAVSRALALGEYEIPVLLLAIGRVAVEKGIYAGSGSEA